jgi:hypothetical protein
MLEGLAGVHRLSRPPARVPTGRHPAPSCPPADLVDTPDDEGERGDQGDDVGGQRGGADQAPQGRQVDERRGEQQLEDDARQQQRVGESERRGYPR